MSKQPKTEKGKVHPTVKTVVKEPRTAATSTLSTVGKAKTGGIEHTHTPAVVVQAVRRADPSLLDPYDWGPEGVPEGQPLHYVPGKGFVLED